MARNIQFKKIGIDNTYVDGEVKTTGHIELINTIGTILLNEKWPVPVKVLEGMALYDIRTRIEPSMPYDLNDVLRIATDHRITSLETFNAAKPSIVAAMKKKFPSAMDEDATDILRPIESLVSSIVQYGLRMDVISKSINKSYKEGFFATNEIIKKDFGIDAIYDLLKPMKVLLHNLIDSNATLMLQDDVEKFMDANTSLRNLVKLYQTMNDGKETQGVLPAYHIVSKWLPNTRLVTTKAAKKSGYWMKLVRHNDVQKWDELQSGSIDDLTLPSFQESATYWEEVEDMFIKNRKPEVSIGTGKALISMVLKDPELQAAMKQSHLTGTIRFSESLSEIDDLVAEIAMLLTVRDVVTNTISDSKIDTKMVFDVYRNERTMIADIESMYSIAQTMLDNFIVASKLVCGNVASLLQDVSSRIKTFSIRTSELYPDMGHKQLKPYPNQKVWMALFGDADNSLSARTTLKRYEKYRLGRMAEFIKFSENRSQIRELRNPWDDFMWFNSLAKPFEYMEIFRDDYDPEKDDVLLRKLASNPLSDYNVNTETWGSASMWLKSIEDKSIDVDTISRYSSDVPVNSLSRFITVRDINHYLKRGKSANYVDFKDIDIKTPFEGFIHDRLNMFRSVIVQEDFDKKLTVDEQHLLRLQGMRMTFYEHPEELLYDLGLAGSVAEFKDNYPIYYDKLFDKGKLRDKGRYLIIDNDSIWDKIRVKTHKNLVDDNHMYLLNPSTTMTLFSATSRFLSKNLLYEVTIGLKEVTKLVGKDEEAKEYSPPKTKAPTKSGNKSSDSKSKGDEEGKEEETKEEDEK